MTTKFAFGILFLLAFSFGTSAQQQTSADLVYGNSIYQKDFLCQLNSQGNYTFGRPMQYVGVALSGNFKVNRKGKFDGNLLAAQYLPQEFRANDSVTGKISGLMFGVVVGYDLFRKAEKIDFIVGGGLNLGRLKLVDNQYLHLKNMLITPKLSAMAKFYFGRLCLILSAEYVYDVSSSDWKEKRGAAKRSASVPVPGFSQSGFNFSVGLGWDVDKMN